MTNAWMVRGGRDGERESAALEEGLVIAGWEELGDLTHVASKQDLRQEIERTYPDEGRATIGNWTGQIWRMIHEMANGDLVVIPLKSRQAIAIGRVAGNYRFRNEAPIGFRHVRSVDWIRTDVPRAAIRQDLLDSMGSLLTICRLERFGAAERIAHIAESGVDPGPPGDDDDRPEVSSKRDLAARAAAATPDEPFRISIRDLLSCWNVVRRSPSAVAQIEADLVDLGLTTRPPFTEGWIDNVIEVLVVGEEPGDDALSVRGRAREADDASDFPPITLRMDVIPSANTGISSVRPRDELRTALTKMIARNYSQLAVIDDDGVLRGAISWESIGKAQVGGSLHEVSSAMTAARVADHYEDLLSWIDEIYRIGYVFVRTPDGSIGGILTAADLTERFGDFARPLVLIEEAERRLRRRVDEVLASEEIKVLTNKKATSAADMTIGNYRHALQRPEIWRRLDWSLDHELFVRLLEEVRKIRNEVMHFSPDPLNETQLSCLQGFVRMLRAVDPRP